MNQKSEEMNNEFGKSCQEEKSSVKKFLKDVLHDTIYLFKCKV